jgi:two-component system, cell cycle response regulator
MDRRCSTSFLDSATASDLALPSSPRLPMYLILVRGGMTGSMFRLSPGENRLGRAHENAILLHERSISRHHALFEVDADGDGDVDGDVWLSDLGSTNGTFLNGPPLDAHAPVRLRDGDRVRLGASCVVKFVRLDECDERFQREMYERTVRDPLTQLYNRAYFLDRVGPLIERSAESGLGLAMLMLDIDHFKRINDAFGHDAGDMVLCEVADVLRESTRPDDLVARHGGEEFAVALPAVTPGQAIDRGERIRASLAARRIVVAETPLRITASIGLAFTPARPAQPPGVLLSLADRLLYQAKATGRNRVVSELDSTMSTREMASPG